MSKLNINYIPVNYKNYDFNRYPVYQQDPRRIGLYENWKYDREKGISENLILPWPEKYERRQPFNAHRVMQNVAAASALLKKGREEDEIVAFFEDIISLIDDFSEVVGDCRFIVNRFAYQWRGRRFPNPWPSALCNGHVLAALAMMYESIGLEAAKDRAEQLLNALAMPVLWDAEAYHFWVSVVDQDGYLWFEERPLGGHEKAHVLNGHIGTSVCLYCYWQATGSERARELASCGMYTVENNADKFRVPNSVNRYDLYRDYIADYGPRRTIQQQRALFSITGDAAFKEHEIMFSQDMPSHIPD